MNMNWNDKLIRCKSPEEIFDVVITWLCEKNPGNNIPLEAIKDSANKENGPVTLCLNSNGYVTKTQSPNFDATAFEFIKAMKITVFDEPFELEFEGVAHMIKEIADAAKVCNCPKENFTANPIGCQCGGV